jgi:hypothetical protein
MTLYVDPGYWRSGYVAEDYDTHGHYRFDGHGRLVFVSELVPSIDVADVYARWKDWVSCATCQDDTSAKWSPAMRYSGYDPIPGGFTGATFFMTNGWRLVFNPSATAVRGVLFSEDLDTAYWNYQLQPVYPVTVSAVVNQVTTTQNIVTGSPEQIAAAILAAAQAAPIHSNIKQVNDITVKGTGTSGDPWNPV